MNNVKSVDTVLKLTTIPRVFKWNVMLFSRTSDRSFTKAAGMILVRHTTLPESSREFVPIPLQLENLRKLQTYGSTKSLLRHNFRKLPVLGSCVNLDEFSACVAKELCCRFHYTPKFFKEDYSDRKHALIIFLDLRVDARTHKPENRVIRGQDDYNVSVSDIEDYLKACPNVSTWNSKALEELEPAIKLLKVRDHRGEEEEDECPICLRGLHEKKYYVRTCCSHMFHDTCIGKWLIKGNSSCPSCRSSFYAQI